MATSHPTRLAARKAPPQKRYLVDNSVWARLSTSPMVVAAFRSIVDLNSPTDILLCPPVAAEIGFSARNGDDHTALREQLSAFPECETAPSSDDVLDIQNRLWNAGLLRAVGAMDTIIAAYAIKNQATVLHYDRDFEHVESVMPGFSHEWIVPRGSLDI